MNKILSLALIIAGVVLMVLVFNAIHSFSSDISRFFTGYPTDKSIWMLIGGIVLSGFGLFSVQQNWKSQ